MAIGSTSNPHTKYRLAVAALLVVVVWFAVALVKTENQRYALSVGLCIDETMHMADLACLARVETRTAWYWHLFYGLTS
jgi:hypothetical protein